jgi:ATP-dependent RNA helicase RhlE
VLVLEEADRMLDLGFVHALRRIMKLLPQQRQTLLFSATMPKAIAVLAEQYLTDPVKVVATPAATTVERIEQSGVFASSDQMYGAAVRCKKLPSICRLAVLHQCILRAPLSNCPLTINNQLASKAEL